MEKVLQIFGILCAIAFSLGVLLAGIGYLIISARTIDPRPAPYYDRPYYRDDPRTPQPRWDLPPRPLGDVGNKGAKETK